MKIRDGASAPAAKEAAVMRTLAIILAQGQQPRLAELPISKAMLPLLVQRSHPLGLTPFEAVAREDLGLEALVKPRSSIAPHVTILERTLVQLSHMERRGELGELVSCVVAHNIILHELEAGPVLDLGPGKEWSRSGPNGGWMRTRWYGGPARRRGIRGVSFAYPRNSALHGVADTLGVLATDGDIAHDRAGEDLQIVVLLGDTVYSWSMLREIVEVPQQRGHGAVVSPQDSSDVRGIAWHTAHDQVMTRALTRALREHPADDDVYQGGQLGRWLTALGYQHAGHADPSSDDYTLDVDTPEDVARLPDRAAAALREDRLQGLVYEGA